jgi:LuxR family maltose regulon positive regulatory protein
MTLARLALAERRPRVALASLQALEASAAESGAIRNLVEIAVLIALCRAALNQRTFAVESLQRALDLAEEENYRRVFLDEGERIVPLLEALAPHSTYAASLLADLHGSGAAARAETLDAPIERLTPREVEILRALASGSSNQDIAERFVLTVGTVKGHVNHILGKLNARNRTEAVARARELGLI